MAPPRNQICNVLPGLLLSSPYLTLLYYIKEYRGCQDKISTLSKNLASLSEVSRGQYYHSPRAKDYIRGLTRCTMFAARLLIRSQQKTLPILI